MFDRLKARLATNKEENVSEERQIVNDFDGYLETGFQLATLQGPLCAEPVEGLAYFVESLEINYAGLEEERGMFQGNLRIIARLTFSA